MDRFRRHWDRLVLWVPLFGALRRKAIAARFLGAFATLVVGAVVLAIYLPMFDLMKHVSQ